jgi:hypothetical protein
MATLLPLNLLLKYALWKNLLSAVVSFVQLACYKQSINKIDVKDVTKRWESTSADAMQGCESIYSEMIGLLLLDLDLKSGFTNL